MIIQLGDILQGAQKVGKATVFFRFPSKAKQMTFPAGLNQDQQWVILGEQVWCLSTCVAKQWVSVLSIVHPCLVLVELMSSQYSLQKYSHLEFQGDTIDSTKTHCFYVVDCDSIASTAFVVPCVPPS